MCSRLRRRNTLYSVEERLLYPPLVPLSVGPLPLPSLVPLGASPLELHVGPHPPPPPIVVDATLPHWNEDAPTRVARGTRPYKARTALNRCPLVLLHPGQQLTALLELLQWHCGVVRRQV